MARRPRIAFFDFADVFEDFYQHYCASQHATRWSDTGNHAFLRLLQRDVGDVVWYVLSLAPECEREHHSKLGCEVVFVRSSAIHRLLWKAFYLPTQAWRWRRLFRAYATLAGYLAPMSLALIATLRRNRPDVIFVQDYASGKFDVLWLLARMLGARFIAYHSGSQPERYLGRCVRRLTLPRTDRLIMSGEKEAQRLRESFAVPADRLKTVLTPLDTMAYRPLARPQACTTIDFPVHRRYVLFVGRLDDRIKRISLLIRAFAAVAAQFDDVDLLIAGDGDDRGDLSALALKLCGERCHFLGWVSGDTKKAALYSAAEFLVLPSVREGFPTVVAESMACGLPVLATDVGGVSEMVRDDDSGYLLRGDIEVTVKQRMAEVLRNAPLRERLSQGARRMAEARVSEAVVSDQLRECFGFARSQDAA